VTNTSQAHALLYQLGVQHVQYRIHCWPSAAAAADADEQQLLVLLLMLLLLLQQQDMASSNSQPIT
jgi:hypothetical protein